MVVARILAVCLVGGFLFRDEGTRPDPEDNRIVQYDESVLARQEADLDGEADEEEPQDPKDPKRFYATLKVAHTADEDEIKRAYRHLALQLHPDKNPDDPLTTEKFQKVQKAYDALSPREQRELYDTSAVITDDKEEKPNLERADDPVPFEGDFSSVRMLGENDTDYNLKPPIGRGQFVEDTLNLGRALEPDGLVARMMSEEHHARDRALLSAEHWIHAAEELRARGNGEFHQAINSAMQDIRSSRDKVHQYQSSIKPPHLEVEGHGNSAAEASASSEAPAPVPSDHPESPDTLVAEEGT